MEKKYAILGDIHANIDALDAVLADAQERGVTDYACVGDIVGYNAAPRECLEKIQALSSVTVRGNHDHYCSHPYLENEMHDEALEVIEWTKQQLTPEHLHWLGQLPLQTNLGAAFMLVHSTLDMPEQWGYVFDPLEAEASMGNQRLILCFCGHTHVPVVFEKQQTVTRLPAETLKLQLGRKYFINAGSVGQPRDRNPLASYCIYDPKDRAVIFRRVAYDIAKAQERIIDAGLPGYLAHRLTVGK